MFDELDDPAFAGAEPGAREAVAARAAAIRRRRRAAWAGGGTSLVLVVAGIAYGMRPAESRSIGAISESVAPTSTGPTPEPSPEPSETIAPTSPSPTPTPTPSPSSVTPSVPHAGPSRSTSPTPTRTVITDSEENLYPPDGRPGWSQGFESCEDLRGLPATGAGPLADVSLRLELPSATLAGGKEYSARLVVSNDGTEGVRFDASMPGYHDTRARDAAGHGSAVTGSDMMRGYVVELAPGQERAFPVRVVTWSCGDTRRSPVVPLPPGTYSMTAGFAWTVREDGAASRSGSWYVPPASVTITE